MASTLVFPPSFRVVDSSGNPVSGAKILCFEAGTSTPKLLYSDKELTESLGSTVYTGSSGFPVASEGSSTTVAVYTGEDPYKLRITTSADVLIWEEDDIVGAPTLEAAEQVAPLVPVTTSGSAHTFEAADRGGGFNYSGNTATFPAAATLGDGWWVHVRNAGSGTGRVVLSAASGISYQGTSYTTLYLEPGQSMTIVCDGTAYRAFADAVLYTPAGFRPNTPGVILVEDRITAEPSTSIGSRYIVATGYGSFSAGDIVTEVASGIFVGTTPTTDCGWLAYVKDENMLYVFVGSAWVPFFSLINELTEDTSPDETADFVATWDNSASLPKKVKPQNFTQSGGLQLLNSGTVTNAATLDIVLTSFTAYRSFVFLLENFVPATDDVELWMRFSTDGGSNYDAGASDYQVANTGLEANADAPNFADSTTAQILIAGEDTANDSVSNTANEGGASVTVTLFNPSAAVWSKATYDSTWVTADGVVTRMVGTGVRVAAQNTDAVRFLFESGNIATATWALYGYI